MTTLNQAVKTFNTRRAAQDALNNEYKTRERVEKLEEWRLQVKSHDYDRRIYAVECWRRRGFWGRIQWLFFGAMLLLGVSVATAAPGLYSTTVYKEETFTRVLTWTDSVGALVDLTGYHATMRVYYSPAGSSSLLLTLTETSGLTLGGAAGTITWVMTDSQTKLFPVGPCRYELRVTDSTGVVTYLLYGNLTVRDRGNL